jgi:very-short-patch-repair endonuclease
VRLLPPNWHDLRATRASRRFNIAGVDDERSIRRTIDVESTARAKDRAVAGLARRQHGVVGRRQLLEVGLGRVAIVERLRHGHLHEVHRGVYVVGARRISRKGQWMAAILAGGPGTVLSHRSAARLWKLLPLAAELVEVSSPSSTRTRRHGVVGHRSSLQKDEWLTRDGIPATSPFRTIFDLAAVAELRELERAFHEAEAREVTDRVSLPMLLERYPGRRGSKNLRELLASRGPIGITRNDFEEAFVALVDRSDLRRPRMNAPLSVRGRFFEIDALWENGRVAVELDSREIHGTHKKFESDRLRDRVLIAEGWRTIRVTWRQLQEEPEAIAEDLRSALYP